MKPFKRPKTEKNGEQWLPDHPWCPNGQIDYGIDEVNMAFILALFLLAEPLNCSTSVCFTAVVAGLTELMVFYTVCWHICFV